jgi:N-acyl-D-aspartate/D-glutamate deacylase
MIVDGTGAPAYAGDLGVRDGRILTIVPAGALTDAAHHTFDATGLVVCPGFVDPHTHYDAQLFWDPFATPSNVHGVTSVIGGERTGALSGTVLRSGRDTDTVTVR